MPTPSPSASPSPSPAPSLVLYFAGSAAPAAPVPLEGTDPFTGAHIVGVDDVPPVGILQQRTDIAIISDFAR